MNSRDRWHIDMDAFVREDTRLYVKRALKSPMVRLSVVLYVALLMRDKKEPSKDQRTFFGAQVAAALGQHKRKRPHLLWRQFASRPTIVAIMAELIHLSMKYENLSVDDLVNSLKGALEAATEGGAHAVAVEGYFKLIELAQRSTAQRDERGITRTGAQIEEAQFLDLPPAPEDEDLSDGAISNRRPRKRRKDAPPAGEEVDI